MQYKILSADNPQELERIVNQYLAQSWKLQGGVSFAPAAAIQDNVASIAGIAYSLKYIQAMIK